MIALTKDQLIAEREMYRTGLGSLHKQRDQLNATIAAQLGVLDYLDRKIEELDAEEKKARAADEAKVIDNE